MTIGQQLSSALLGTKSIPELRTILTARGAGFDMAESKKQLIVRLITLDGITQPDYKLQQEEKVEPQIKSAPDTHTQADVLAAVDPWIKRGMKVSFDQEGKTWHFKRYIGDKFVAEDSGSMRIPLVTIKRCAELLHLQLHSSNIKR